MMRLNKKEPYFINFNSIGKTEIGFISIAEQEKEIPFKIKRVFWTYYTPNDVLRGKHAHHKLEQVLIVPNGTVTIETENSSGIKNKFVLNKPTIGLYVPPDCWHTMTFSHNSILVSIASMEYNENDYLRDYNEFKRLSRDGNEAWK